MADEVRPDGSYPIPVPWATLPPGHVAMGCGCVVLMSAPFGAHFGCCPKFLAMVEKGEP